MSFSSSFNLASGAYLAAPPLIRSQGRSWRLESVPCKKQMGDRKTSVPWSPTGCCLVLLSHICVLLTQFSLTLCDPMDCSPQGSSVHGISQARILGVGCHFLHRGIFQTQGLFLNFAFSEIIHQSFFFWPHCMVYMTLILQPGIELCPLQWKLAVLTTGLPGKSQF